MGTSKKYYIRFFVIISLMNLLGDCRPKTKSEFDSLKQVFESLHICLNVDSEKWNDTIRKNREIKDEWRYFCDSTYFKVHNANSEGSLLLLEARIGHGSGEYDNFLIQRHQEKYTIISEFKGYLDSIITGRISYKFIYSFNTSPERHCKVVGIFNGKEIVTDTILNFNVTECKDVFIKGTPWK